MSHKGRVADILTKLRLQRYYGAVTTVGLGDSLNVLPLLIAVDRPVLVKKEFCRHDAMIGFQAWSWRKASSLPGGTRR